VNNVNQKGNNLGRKPPTGQGSLFVTMTILYDAGDLGTFRALLRWKGTMLPLVIGKPVFWVLLLLHAGLCVLKNLRQECPPAGCACPSGTDPPCGSPYLIPLPKLPWSAVGSVTALLTFFLVFYGSQSYARLQQFYGHCVGLAGATMDWVGLVRNHLPEDPNVQWNCTRLVLAALHIQYYTLNESDGGEAIDASEWKRIIKRHLLKQSEIDTISAYAGYKPFLPLVWALAEVEDALLPEHASEQTRMSERFRVSDLLTNFRQLAFAFRGHCGQISNWLKQPVPFVYFHALTLLLLLDMVLVSYGLAREMVPELSGLVYTIFLVAMLGLREVCGGRALAPTYCHTHNGHARRHTCTRARHARHRQSPPSSSPHAAPPLLQVAVAMSDPFGDDDVDFDLEPMLAGAYKNSVAVLSDHRASNGADLGSLLNPIVDSEARFTVGPSARPRDSSAGSGQYPGIEMQVGGASAQSGRLLSDQHTSSEKV
jgi:hypothetical protein